MNEGTRTVAVVTGGASGIGLALAEALGSSADSVLVADIDSEALAAAVERLQGAGIDAHGKIADLRDDAQVRALADAAARLGTITTVCLNAGVTATGTDLWETPAATVEFVLDVNLVGLVTSIRAFVPLLVAQDSPSTVVITASMAGMVTSGGSAIYSASKAGAVAAARALRAELAVAAPQVGVVVCNPGMVQTNLMRTSAGQMSGLIDEAFVEVGHDALNGFGIAPADQASAVLDAIDSGSFWVLPPRGDPFTDTLKAELTALLEEIDR